MIFTDPENRAKSFSKTSSCPLRIQDMCNTHKNVIFEVSVEHNIYGRNERDYCRKG
jgi:hypothetical protein